MQPKTISRIITIIVLACLLPLTTSLFAMDFGENITIFDESTSNTYFHSGQNTGYEDQEVEPADQAGQRWDLEGMFLDTYQLTLVGGFDFMNGEENYLSGDIFIDTDLAAEYGERAEDNDSLSSNGYQTITNNYGYDYVLDLDFANLLYYVYAIDTTTNLQSVYYRVNDGSNPWQFTPGNNDQYLAMGQINYFTGLTDTDTGFSGGNHNAFSVNLSFLPESTEFIAHFTIGCGNDNLMGQGVAHAPEPATLLLFGSGIFGLAALGRRRQRI